MYAYIVDANVSYIYVRNDTDSVYTVYRHTKIGKITDSRIEGYYLIRLDNYGLIALDPNNVLQTSKAIVYPDIETTLLTSVTVFGDLAKIAKVAEIVNYNPRL